MIELNSKIKNALIKIGFIERYEELSNKFNAKRTPSSNRLAYIDSEEVMETIQDLGYSPVFDVKEKFYYSEIWNGRFSLDSQRKWRIASWGSLGNIFKETY